MKKLSDEQIKKAKELRQRGLSFREIEKQLGISYGAAFYYARDTEKHHARVQIHIEGMSEEEKAELTRKTAEMVRAIGGAGSAVFEFDGTSLALVHLPYTIICHDCGAENNHVRLCLECGGGLCVECWSDIDIKTAQRKEESSLV